MNPIAAHPKWVFRTTRQPQARVRWYCFPFAGGAAHFFAPWAQLVPADVEIRAIQLPGHGTRISEPLIDRLDPLLDAIMDALLPEWSQGPFVLFGHSMGGMLSHELARRLRRIGGPRPLAVAISGRAAPRVNVERRIRVAGASDDELWQELQTYNGTPPSLFDDPEVKKVFLPIIRADFSIVEFYNYVAEPPLDVPLRIAVGIRDTFTPPGSELGWKNETTAGCTIRRYDGDHFFLKANVAEFVSHLYADIPPVP